ncbi:hypothetical protein KDD30_03125 [Photobacterium sp. GJ3]|uniref:hypothetical protein n=1 Tax=Photobacterium sp. GJ3 TaxID=2829502 RepID=UPI001B8D01C0|nr:hypothetical protein [Photobacterium sp. GJ3]QUJ68155.1 hypothetical protein KDD30_03125 [Photobacterium sp. GJ3]
MNHVSLSTYGGLIFSMLAATVVAFVLSPLLISTHQHIITLYPSVNLPGLPVLLAWWPGYAVAAVVAQGLSLWLLNRAVFLGKCLTLFATLALFPFGLFFHICYFRDAQRIRFGMLQEVPSELKPEHPQFGFCDEDPLAFGLAGVGVLLLFVGVPFGILALLAGMIIFARNLAGKKKTALLVTSDALYITPNPWLGCYRIPFAQVAQVSVVKNQLKLEIRKESGEQLTLPININVLDRDLRHQARHVLLDRLAHAGLLHEPVVVP